MVSVQGKKGINIVICMAGKGSRFANAGYTLPKPLIVARGRPLFLWSVESLDFYNPKLDNLIFVCLKEHLDKFDMGAKLRESFPSAKIVPVGKVTEGQACTVLLAKELIDNDAPLCVFNIDTIVKSSLRDKVRDKKKRHDGIISVFRGNNPHHSYAKVGPDGFVTEVAEKRMISEFASAGLYFFSKGSDFVRAAEAMVRKNIRVNNEFYVIPVYQELITEGKKIIPDFIEYTWDLGTPDALERFEKNYKG